MAESAPGAATPAVTVLIPTYERADFLDASIGSLLGQDYERLEVLVLDDGSTDRTPEILERYAAEHPDRFRWTRHENIGQARTLNTGFELARGELVGYLSSDDELLPGAISKLAAAFVAAPETVVAYPAWEYIDAGGSRIDSVMPVEFTLAHAIGYSDPVIGPGALVRRTAVERAGGWDPDLRYSPDFEFWLRIASLGSFRRVPEILARYRWHEGMTGRSDDGFEIARERVAIAERFFAGDDIPEEVRQVEAEAYRSAFLVGAGLLGPNAPWERFFLADRLDNRTFERRRSQLPAMAERLRLRVGELERELGSLSRRVAALGDTLARQENEAEA